MLLSSKVKIKWNSKIKRHYVDLGYMFTRMGDEFEVNICDLTNGSSVCVEVKCDYCGINYTKQWRKYLEENNNSNIHKDACGKCKHFKASESVNKTYGVINVFKLSEVKEKIIDTNLNKYGVENPFQSEYIKEKIKHTNLKKYGHEYAMKSPIIKEKVKKFNMIHYGIEYSPYLNITHKKGSMSPRWMGGLCKMDFIELRINIKIGMMTY